MRCPELCVPALAAALVMIAPSAPARADNVAPGTYEIPVSHGDSARFFLLHVPPQAAQRRPLPLVLNLHGGGGEPREHLARTRMDDLADREGFILVYPAGYARKGAPGRALLTWNAGGCCGPADDEQSDDVGFVLKVLGETNARVPVDATRVYATGFSNGAMMTYRLARELPGIAAIAPVAGGSAIAPPESVPPTPVLHIHSVDDGRAIYAGGEGPPFPVSGRRVRAAGPPLRFGARPQGAR